MSHQTSLRTFFQSGEGGAFSEGAVREKRQRVDRLLQLNRDMDLHRNPTTNLYCDRRQPSGVQMRPGITSLLRRHYYSHYVFPEKRRGRSGTATGSRFHRHMYHRVMCRPLQVAELKRRKKERKRFIEEFKLTHGGKEPKRIPRCKEKLPCVCERKYGSRTHDTRLKEGSAIAKWLKQADEFMKKRELTPIACEVVVSCRRLTTEIDMLAWKEKKKVLVNVSWKTGSTQQMDQTTRRSSSSQMSGKASHIANTEHQHAQLQQFVEDRILREGHELETDEHCIVYFGSRADGSYVVKEPSGWRKRKESADALWMDVCEKGR